jgi:serine phosphatase RsbU (regulator of sigma subunit)
MRDSDKTQAELLEELDALRRQRQRDKAAERIRTEVSSMRSSEDMLKVVAIMLETMIDLGVQTPASSISFMDEESDRAISYMAGGNPRKYGLTWTSSNLVEVNADVAVFSSEWTISSNWNETWTRHAEIWRRGTPGSWETQVTRESFAQRSEYTRFGFNGDPARWAEFVLGDWTVTSVPFKYGTVAYRERSYIEEHVDVVRQLTEALSLGYLRYLNIQQREQAQRQHIQELTRELQTARDLQMDLMPKQAPQLEGFDFAGCCIPAKQVGGDFFQYFPLSRHRLAIGMADVTGHAMEAAIPVVMFSGILRGETRHGNSLEQLFGNLNIEQLFANLNRTLCESLDSHTFVCFLMGEFNAYTRTFRFSNSGCPYPFHYRASSGDVVELQADAYPLGVRPDTLYRSIEVPLEPGDLIVLCSDGLIEARSTAGEHFGFERMAATISQGGAARLNAEAQIDEIFGRVKSFMGEATSDDDMTCIVVAVTD